MNGGRQWVGVQWGSVVLACAIVLGGCGRGNGVETAAIREADPSRSASPEQPSVEKVNRIAYVSPDGDVHTISPDGGNLKELTGGVRVMAGARGAVRAQPMDLDSYYTWPTWSPDGTLVAASRVRAAGQLPQLSVEVLDTGTGRGSTLFGNMVPGMVAEGAPHYLYWSPDGRSLAFLATTSDGLALFVADIDRAASPQVVEAGAPLYFQWAADARSILVHVGAAMKVVGRPFGTESKVLVADAVGFRTAALSPDGSQVAYARTTEAGPALFVASTDAPRLEKRLLPLGALSAFLWSPDGRELAVADRESAGSPLFQRLRVVPSEGGQARTITEGAIVAFYWSPGGERIAWVGVDLEARVFELAVAPRMGSPALRLFRFQPSRDTLTMLSFFDQYAYSHSPWSPDGAHLVLAGRPGPTVGRPNGQTPTGDRVFVIDATGATAPKEIAAGTLAFWSWN